MILQSFVLILVTFIILSSNSFWNLWVSLELYSFFLIPWLMENENKTSKTSIFFYYITQFLASVGLLVGSLTMFNEICSSVVFFSLLMKMSCFPFHSWFISVVSFISWDKILVLSTLSKLIPLSILVLMAPPSGFLWILVAGLVVSLGGYDTSCLRSLLAYSSVTHSSWIVISTCLSKPISIVYMSVYSMIILMMCIYMSKESLTDMKSSINSKKGNTQLILLVLTLSGIPPFLGFVLKLLVILPMVCQGLLLEAGVLGILSMLPVYFYFKIGSLSFTMKSSLEFMFSYSLSFIVTLGICISVVILTFLLSLSLHY